MGQASNVQLNHLSPEIEAKRKNESSRSFHIWNDLLILAKLWENILTLQVQPRLQRNLCCPIVICRHTMLAPEAESLPWAILRSRMILRGWMTG